MKNNTPKEIESYFEQIDNIATSEFKKMFLNYFCDVRKRKLGFLEFKSEDEKLWSDLEELMFK